ncbi:hypothetical protein ACVSXV_22910 [Yersinia enterocolitica]
MDKVMQFLNSVASELSSKQVKVGFLEGSTYDGVIPVPMVAATNEFGNPANNQPPRPFFRNAISEHEAEWGEKMAALIEGGLAVDDALSTLGEIISDDIRESIRKFETPALSPVTVAKKGFSKPLIDTGNMLNSVSYEVGEIEPSSDS